MMLRRILFLAALTSLCACGQQTASGSETRNYAMRNLRKGEQVTCSWTTTNAQKALPYAQDPDLPRDCIALCMRAGFHGEDRELEQFVGYQAPIPDRKAQISMNIPAECQM